MATENAHEGSNVRPFVRRIVEETFGGSPVEKGKRYEHPTDGVILILGGQYWGRDGLSNHWTWQVIATGEIKSGYGGEWPEADSIESAIRRHPARGRHRPGGDDGVA